MKWYLCWAAGSNFRTDHDWENLIRAALYSAKANTSLEPVIVIDGAPSAFTEELQEAGATVVFHQLSFSDALAAHYPNHGVNLHVFLGAFLRFDIPLIEKEAEYVLYTDCDVLFLRQPEFLPAEMPKYFAAAPENLPDDYADMNSGVMLINVGNMRALHGQLVAFARANLHLGLDQAVLRAAFGASYTHLRPELNWKPYWGFNPEAMILHFHGPKPVTVRNYLADRAFSSHANWDALFRRNPEGYLLSERRYSDFLRAAQAAKLRQSRPGAMVPATACRAENGSPAWQIDLGRPATIREIAVFAAVGSGGPPHHFRLAVSIDGQAWVEIGQGEADDDASYRWNGPGAAWARFVRIGASNHAEPPPEKVEIFGEMTE